MRGSQRAAPGAACGLAAVLLLATAAPPAGGPAVPGPAVAAPGGFVVRGAHVFDGTRMLGIADVQVSGGQIVAVGRDLAVPPGTAVVAGAGGTLLPGLIDAHAHSLGDTLRDALVFGVTTELDMFADPRWAAKVKADQAAGGRLDEADLRSAGTLATVPGGHGTEYGFPIPTLTRPDEAQAWVDARIAEGSDYIKIIVEDGKVMGRPFPTLDQATVVALVAAAHRRGKLAVVHATTLATARAAIDAGADGLEHLFVDRLPDPGFGRFVAAHHAFVVPTLSVLRDVAGDGAGAALVRDPRLAPYIDPDNAANLERRYPERPGKTAIYVPAPAAVRQLAAAGARILAGTDAPNSGTAHGASLHGELQLLVEAGLTPTAALAAATSAPAAAFHLADRGRIAPGLRADLVLVEGDPTADILQTRAIVQVWKLGVAADRDAFRAEVAGASAAKATFGRGWSASNDRIIGGTSTATLAVVDDAPPEPAASPAGASPAGPSPAAYQPAADATPPAPAPAAGGAAAAAGRALAVTGKVAAAGGPFAWAGASLSPGDAPFAVVDLSARKGLHFWARGDGRTYQVMVFSQGHGRMPLAQSFSAGPAWKELAFPWSSFSGYDGHDVQSVVFAAVAPPGPFAFRLAGVRLE
jgi:imidazolonepropionase-like amidohydrolase